MKKKSVWGSIDRFVDRRQLVLLSMLVLIAFVVRIIHLGTTNMWIDETLSAVATLGILEHGYPLLASGEGYFRAELFHYAMAFFMMIFGANDFGARFISVLFGVATVVLGFYLGKKFSQGNSFVGLTLALFLTFSSLEIIYSKQARFYQAFQFFYFLSFFLFYKIVLNKEKIFKKDYLNYALLVISILLTMHLQVMGLIIVPLFFGIYLLYNRKDVTKLLQKKVFWIFAIITGLVALYILYRLSGLLSLSYLSRVYIYGEVYLSYYIEYLPIFMLSLVGMILALRDNWKLHLSFIGYSAIPFLGLFFISTFATRYVYFVLFLLFFYLVYLLSKVQFKYLFVVLILAFYSTTAFSFTGIEYPRLDPSMPDANYNEAYTFLGAQKEFEVVSTWPQAGLWYSGSGPDHWINYSLAGRNSSPWMYTDSGIERFTGANVINSVSELPELFYFVVDAQSIGKINNEYRVFIESYCNPLFVDYNIVVYGCSQSVLG